MSAKLTRSTSRMFFRIQGLPAAIISSAKKTLKPKPLANKLIKSAPGAGFYRFSLKLSPPFAF
jgi:hypothetical protein